MRVTVVFGQLRVSQDFVDYPYFADLGALQASSTLEQAGFATRLVDAFALPGAGLATDDADPAYLRMGAPTAPPMKLNFGAMRRTSIQPLSMSRCLASAASRCAPFSLSTTCCGSSSKS